MRYPGERMSIGCVIGHWICKVCKRICQHVMRSHHKAVIPLPQTWTLIHVKSLLNGIFPLQILLGCPRHPNMPCHKPCLQTSLACSGCQKMHWTSRDVMDMHRSSSNPQDDIQGWRSDVIDMVLDKGPFLRVHITCTGMPIDICASIALNCRAEPSTTKSYWDC